jgi:hypothetical protein
MISCSVALGEAAHRGGSTQPSKTSHYSQEAKQQEEKGTGSDSPFEVYSQ